MQTEIQNVKRALQDRPTAPCAVNKANALHLEALLEATKFCSTSSCSCRGLTLEGLWTQTMCLRTMIPANVFVNGLLAKVSLEHSHSYYVDLGTLEVRRGKRRSGIVHIL
jgi:hypothetical protein